MHRGSPVRSGAHWRQVSNRASWWCMLNVPVLLVEDDLELVLEALDRTGPQIGQLRLAMVTR